MPINRHLRLGALCLLSAALLSGAMVQAELPFSAREAQFGGKPHIELAQQVLHQPVSVPLTSDEVELMIWNLEHFSDGKGDWTGKTIEASKGQSKHAAALIDSIGPDILMIFEIENREMVDRLTSSLTKKFSYAWITNFGSDLGKPVTQNIALFSRYALKGVREIDFEALTGPGRPPRGLLSFFLQLDEKHRLLVYAVHLKANVGDQQAAMIRRWNAMRLIALDAKTVRAEHPDYEWEVVVCGDMNTDPESKEFVKDPTLQPLLSVGFIDPWLGGDAQANVTHPVRAGSPYQHSAIAFDRFVFSADLSRDPWRAETPRAVHRGVGIADANLKPGVTAEHISDHYPVLMKIQRNRPPVPAEPLVPEAPSTPP